MTSIKLFLFQSSKKFLTKTDNKALKNESLLPQKLGLTTCSLLPLLLNTTFGFWGDFLQTTNSRLNSKSEPKMTDKCKKKSLFRSLCSTFNDLEKFNELKTHTYIILFHFLFLKIYSPTVQFSCSKTIWNWLRKKQLETTAQSFWYHSTDVSLPIPMILQKCWFVVWVFEK